MKNICLAISLIGIFVLLLIINLDLVKIQRVSDIDNLSQNKIASITGKVISKQIYENNFTVLKINDKSGEIDIVCSCPEIKINQTILVTGKIKGYKNQMQINQMQINADKIKLIN